MFLALMGMGKSGVGLECIVAGVEMAAAPGMHCDLDLSTLQ